MLRLTKEGMMRWLISLALVVLTFSAAAAPGDIMLELMASPAKFTDSLSLGHAFFCVEYQLNSGIKEDCFVFYPKTTSGMFVGGPGVTNSEFQKNPQRFSNVVSSYKSQL